LGALLLIVAVLSACGGNDASPSASPSSSGPASPSASTPASPEASPSSSEAATRVYKDALGREVEIPTHPQKVITTQYLPEMIAVGAKPIGVATHLLTNFKSIKDQIGGIEDIGAANEPNVEKMLTLQPDLIIATEWNQDRLEDLNKIAPTVVVQWENNDAIEHMKDVADVLGLNAEADKWLADYEQEAAEAREKLAPFVKPEETFGVVVIGGYEKGQLRVYGNGNVGYTLFDTLKFPMTDTVKTEWDKGNNSLGLSISLEKLPEFASADRLFLVRFDNDPDFLKEVDESSLWKNLPAVKNGKVYTVDPDIWFSYDVMSFRAQLKDAFTLLGAK